jgi:hypothetical protein
MYGILNFPCWLRSFGVMFVVPTFCANIFIKLMTFSFMSQLSQNMSKVQRLDDDMFHAEKPAPWCDALSNIAFSIHLLLFNPKDVPQNKLIVALSFMTSTKGLVCVIFIFELPFLLLALVTMSTRNEVCFYYRILRGCYLAVLQSNFSVARQLENPRKLFLVHFSIHNNASLTNTLTVPGAGLQRMFSELWRDCGSDCGLCERALAVRPRRSARVAPPRPLAPALRGDVDQRVRSCGASGFCGRGVL